MFAVHATIKPGLQVGFFFMTYPTGVLHCGTDGVLSR